MAITITISATDALGAVASTTTTATQSTGNTLHATTANFAAQVSAATPGTTIFMASGNYGNWVGTNKAIILVPEAGANVTMSLDLNAGNGGWTVDGGHTEISQSTNGMVRSALPFTSSGITITDMLWAGASSNPPQNITIMRCWFTGVAKFDNDPTNGNAGWTFDRCYWNNIPSPPEACFQIWGKNIMIKNCLFNECTADAVKLSQGNNHTVQDCEFRNVNPHGGGNHTDCIQQNGADTGIFLRNFFTGFEQAIGLFDGTGSNTITDNVFDNRPTPAAHWITMGGDNPSSLVHHNTVWGAPPLFNPVIVCGSKPGNPLSITSIRNNIGDVDTTGIAGGANGQPIANDHNMTPGNSSPNINGTATFVGGSHPTTYQGYKLATGSAGLNAASDGFNVGARIA